MKTIIVIISVIGILTLFNIDYNSYNMKNIKDFLRDQVDANQTPSIQYAFFDTDSIIYEMQYGLKNVKTNTSIDTATTYHLYSVTKTFTALAVLQLAQAKKLELKRPVSEYLPGFPYDKSITVEQLLSHTSGIPNPMPLRWIHLATEHADFDRKKFFTEVFKKHSQLDFSPGTDFKYSNLGYVILGDLIETISGQSLEEYIEENIIQRSGISSNELGFEINPSIHAVGYHKWLTLSNAIFGFLIDKPKFMGKRERRWKPFHPFYNNGTAYGGMVGSASGLIRYAQALLMKDSVLLTDEFKKILFSETIIKDKPTGMSYSWFTGSLKGHRYFAHAGGGGGYYVELRVYPDLGVGSVILYNRSGMTDERILSKADRFFITENENELKTIARR